MAANILLIHSDQHRFDCVGVHGHPVIKTPVLDQLARDGADFTHAFTPSPICTPARASLLTGRWPTQHGVVSIPKTEIYRCVREDERLFWQELSDAGYQQALFGKWHNETPRDPSSYGVRYLPESDYTAWRAGQGLAPQPNSNGWFGEVDPHILTEQHRLAWEAREVSACMESFAASKAPWMIRWDPSEPHLPNVIPAAIADMYPPETIPPWPSFADTLRDKPFIQSQQRRTWGVADWTWKEWSLVVSRYLAEITLMDEQIGKVLATLDRLGLRDSTLVIYTTDHGDYCGGHGQMDKHFNMYDDVVRVPLIMRWPGMIPAGVRRDDFVSHEIDLARTVVTVATNTCPDSFQGVDLVPVAKGEQGTGRRDVFAQFQGAQFGLYSQRMLRDSRWKYVWNLTDVDELYDLEADPGELTNLASHPDYGNELSRLRRQLTAWLESISDPLLNEFTRVQLHRIGVKP